MRRAFDNNSEQVSGSAQVALFPSPFLYLQQIVIAIQMTPDGQLAGGLRTLT
jgi:hypothetical protein